jgi:hypothetical protein
MFKYKVDVRKRLSRFLADTGGNFAIISALTLPILAAGIGLALDYSHSLSLRSRLTSAADSAVLAGLRAGADAKAQGDPKWQKVAEAEARNFFAGYVQSEKLRMDISFSPIFTDLGSTIQGDAKYTYDEDTFVMQMFGIKKVAVGQAPRATIGDGNFIDIGFLIDNSGSMGIGATKADQDAMYAKIKNGSGAGCAFACHIPKNDWEAPFTPDKAKAIGAKLRIDVVRDAMRQALQDLSKKAKHENIRVSVYTFSNSIETLIEPTTDLAAALKKIETLDLIKQKSGGPSNLGGTYIRTALTDLKENLDAAGKPGTGESKSARKSFVVVMSDGIEDSQSNVASGGGLLGGLLKDFNQSLALLAGWQTSSIALTSGGLIMQPFDSATCSPMKKDGRTIYSAQIRYNTTVGMRDQPWNPPLIDYIGAVAKDLEKAFDKCASSKKNHVIAENSAEIGPMFKTIIDEIIDTSTMRLTN